jgi:predicted DNA-binding transcriptional regulator YafY
MLAGTYQSPHEPGPVRLRLHPCRIALVKQAWYLIARPDGESGPRTYRVVRFQTLKMIDRPAEVPNDLDLRAYFGNAWAVYRGDRSYDVELRFSPEAAGPVVETTWHHTQTVARHPDGSATLTFTVDGLNEIVRWVVGYAGDVRVVRPAELRDLVVERHRRAVAVNGEN